jgi:hypothetical protein
MAKAKAAGLVDLDAAAASGVDVAAVAAATATAAGLVTPIVPLDVDCFGFLPRARKLAEEENPEKTPRRQTCQTR